MVAYLCPCLARMLNLQELPRYFFAPVRRLRRVAFRALWINRFRSSMISVPSPSRLAFAICQFNSAMGSGPIACSSFFRISLNFVVPIITMPSTRDWVAMLVL